MATVKCMNNFIITSDRSKAHFESVILEEIARFVDVVDAKKQISGVLWPFHKIVNYEDTDINISHFPSLAVCAVEFFKKFKEETYKYMVTPKFTVKKEIVSKCKILVDYMLIDGRQLSEDAKRGAEILGVRSDEELMNS